MRALRRPPTSVLLALLAATFFFTPAVVWVLGVRATPIENRPFTPLPSLGTGWHAFDQLSQWGIDRLPLRADAIRLNTDLSKRLFHELPTIDSTGAPVGIGQGGQVGGVGTRQSSGGPPPRALQVIAGKQGWLYYGDEFVRACSPEAALPDVLARVRRLGRILAASGRRFLFAVAPDKHSLTPEYLPADLPEKGCALRATTQRLAALRAARLATFVDVPAALTRRQRELGRPIYQKTDTHWDSDGDVVFVRAMVGALDPALLHATRFVRLPRISYVGDLAVLSGAPAKTSTHPFAVQRAGVTRVAEHVSTPLPNYPITTAAFRSAPGGAPLFGTSTLIYGDSFAERTLGLLLPFFRDATRIPELTRAAVSGSLAPAQQRLIDEIEHHRVIVMEQVERTFWGTVSGSILDPAFLDRLADALGVSRAG
jgi:alginate O-acetyltransferase complex protein AlgJ